MLDPGHRLSRQLDHDLFLRSIWNQTRTNSDKEGDRIMWIKDAFAGAGLILFMVSAFVLASGAHAVLNHIPA